MIGNEATGDVSCLQEIAVNIKTDHSNWVEGDMKGKPHLHFSAKIFARGSQYGIRGGRISKLEVFRNGKWDVPGLEKMNKVEEAFYQYDRGDEWIKSGAKEVKQFVNRMVKLLK